MTKRVRVNVRSLANTKAMRKEKRNGRDVVIVPSATLPDDVVMNDVQYPADEIEKSYKTLERTPAPLGHPMIGNKYVSARDPEGINVGWVGAWNENVRRENGRVFLDKVIDVQRANQSDEGKAVLAAIEKGEPVHTSTGLYCNLEAANGDVEYSHVARGIEFDHDAILIGERGAATPEQGVGMFVNSNGEQEEVKVINSALEDAERELEWAADWAVRAVERMERASIVDRIVSAIKSAVGADEGRETSANKGDADMADEDQIKELSAKVNALTEAQENIGDTIAAAVTEAMKPIVEANKAQADAKRLGLVNEVVEAKIDGLTEEVASKMDEAALSAVLKLHKAEPKKAAPLTGGFAINLGQEQDSMSPLAWGAKQ